MKYRNHPSINAIQSKWKDKDSFNFAKVDQKQIEKEILKLHVNKASQSSDISIKVLKENTDMFSNFLCNSCNSSIKSLMSSETLKHADIACRWKRYQRKLQTSEHSSKFIKNIFKKASLNKCPNFLRIYFQNINNALTLQKAVINFVFRN